MVCIQSMHTHLHLGGSIQAHFKLGDKSSKIFVAKQRKENKNKKPYQRRGSQDSEDDEEQDGEVNDEEMTSSTSSEDAPNELSPQHSPPTETSPLKGSMTAAILNQDQQQQLVYNIPPQQQPWNFVPQQPWPHVIIPSPSTQQLPNEPVTPPNQKTTTSPRTKISIKDLLN